MVMIIYRITGLFSSSYLIEKSKRLFLVDTGFLGFHRDILRTIGHIGRKPDDLKLVILTHGHLDHCGGLKGLRERTNCLVGCHPLDAPGVAGGGKTVSPGLTKPGKFLEFLSAISLPFFWNKGVRPDLYLTDGASLSEYGLPARIIHTPGHTAGHISVLLEDGRAITGDLVLGKTLFCRQPSSGSMALSPGDVRFSWSKIIKSGAQRLFPAHGDSFSIDELKRLAAQ